MILHTFGTSAGTQPLPMHHHTCLALETNSSVYWIDAGECGAYTAALAGVDLLKTRAIFITHPHMDHIGGLGNLLWYCRKMTFVKNEDLKSGNIDIFTSSIDSVEGFFQVLKNTEGDFACSHTHKIHKVFEGEIYKNEEICVTAVPTTHMAAVDGEPKSYSYKIECDGQTVIFSGDMRLEDFDNIFSCDCDALLVETGHHQIEEIAQKLSTINHTFKKIYFVHHGGYIIKNSEQAQKRVFDVFGSKGVITFDSDKFLI